MFIQTWLSWADVTLRFIVTGVINTTVGFAAYFLMVKALGINPIVANVGAYLLGLALFFFVSKSFVFSSRMGLSAYGLRFLGVFAVAYALNALVFVLLLDLAGAGPMLSQLVAMTIYSTTFLVLGKRFLSSSRGKLAKLNGE